MKYILSIPCLDKEGNIYSYDVSGIVPYFDIECNKTVWNELEKAEKIIKRQCHIKHKNIGKV